MLVTIEDTTHMTIDADWIHLKFPCLIADRKSQRTIRCCCRGLYSVSVGGFVWLPCARERQHDRWLRIDWFPLQPGGCQSRRAARFCQVTCPRYLKCLRVRLYTEANMLFVTGYIGCFQMTTFGAGSDENLVKITLFLLRCLHSTCL